MPPESARRSRPLSARPAGRPTGAQQATNPCVVGAMLRGQPELRLLTEAVAGVARLELVDDRFALVPSVAACRPGVLVLLPFDADRTSTVPLVLRVRREVPGAAILVLSSHPAGAGQPILRAAQAGAHILTSPTAADLNAAITALLESRTAER